MNPKQKNPRRENRKTIFMVPELIEALDKVRLKKPGAKPPTWSTFLLDALAEWADMKGIVWRKSGGEKNPGHKSAAEQEVHQ